MSDNIVSVLASTDLFEGLTPAQLEMIAALCEPVVLHQGEILFKEGDTSTELYVIQSGALEILMSPTLTGFSSMVGPVVITELRQGQIVGEIALMEDGPRTATARATTFKTYLLKIPQQKLLLLCETYPTLGYRLLRNLVSDLAVKIRNTDLTLRQYQLMLSSHRRMNT